MDKIKTDNKVCYIRPTNKEHDSGFNCFEIGYILKMSRHNRVLQKQVIGSRSDHIYQDYMMLLDNKKNSFCLNMDLTPDGYIRLWSHEGEVIWDVDIPLSSMRLKIKNK